MLWGSASDLADGHREAEWMLGAPSVKGHLKVTVEHGRLHYALWERDASPKKGLALWRDPGLMERSSPKSTIWDEGRWTTRLTKLGC
jgi:hypothetical protein